MRLDKSNMTKKKRAIIVWYEEKHVCKRESDTMKEEL